MATETAPAPLDLDRVEADVEHILRPLGFETRKVTSSKTKREGSWERTVNGAATQTAGDSTAFSLFDLEDQLAEILAPHGLELKGVGAAHVRRENSWERTVRWSSFVTADVQKRLPLKDAEEPPQGTGKPKLRVEDDDDPEGV